MKYLFYLLFYFFSTNVFSEDANSNNNPESGLEVSVDNVNNQIDLVKYEGLWIEIARKYNKYEDRCNAFVMYHDYISNSGKVKFSTYCLDKNKTSMLIIKGEANPIDKFNQIFSIKTDSSLLNFLGFFHKIYYVIYYVDLEYKYAIIGDKSKSVISILSREIVDEYKLQELLKITESLGINIDNFYIDNTYKEDIQLLISKISNEGKLVDEN